MDPDNNNVKIFIICCICVFCCLSIIIGGYFMYNSNMVVITPTTTPTITTIPITESPIPTTPIPTTPIPTNTTTIPLTPTPDNGLINIEYMGCYGDQADRVLPLSLGNLTLPECAKAAKNISSPYFGMQYGMADTSISQCYAGASTTTLADTQKVGAANNCKAITNPTILTTYPGSYVGDVWSNAIYKLL